MIRVVLLDDHAILTDAIRHILEPEFVVAGAFRDGQYLLDQIQTLDADIAVLDIGMTSMNGLTVAEKLSRLAPRIKIVFLTMYQDEATVREALRLGVAGYVLKADAVSDLIRALRLVSKGGRFFSHQLDEAYSFPNPSKNKPPYQLTPRQREVLQLLGEGYSMPEIARSLGITPRTVAFHKYTMMQEMNVSTSAELLTLGLRLNLIQSV